VRLRNSVIERWSARAAVAAASALFATVRRRMIYEDPETSPYRQPTHATYLFSVWHDSLLMPLFLGRQPRTVALVGMHQDGTFLKHSLAALGIPAVRGSSSRGGAEAVSQLLSNHAEDHIVVTPDGPRGPRRRMKPGIAFLASRTGKPVVATAFACRKFWSVGSGWTSLAIPRPWTTIYAMAGDGVRVPPDADKQTLRDYTARIQAEMDRLNGLVENMAAGNEEVSGRMKMSVTA
jgi:lysophospholipid acyltransferase (LPLAT)-like uncharacterized protein